jgi:hypothetical protein
VGGNFTRERYERAKLVPMCIVHIELRLLLRHCRPPTCHQLFVQLGNCLCVGWISCKVDRLRNIFDRVLCSVVVQFDSKRVVP